MKHKHIQKKKEYIQSLKQAYKAIKGEQPVPVGQGIPFVNILRALEECGNEPEKLKP